MTDRMEMDVVFTAMAVGLVALVMLSVLFRYACQWIVHWSYRHLDVVPGTGRSTAWGPSPSPIRIVDPENLAGGQHPTHPADGRSLDGRSV